MACRLMGDIQRPSPVMSAVLSPPVQACRAWLTMRASQCLGDVEFTSTETYKEVVEVNLWGTVRGTKPFLPLI